MCDAATALAAGSLAVGVIGTGMQAYGQHQQGKSQAAWAEYNATVAENQRLEAKYQAQYEADRLEERKKRALSSQFNSLAASGFVMADDEEGSPLSLLSATQQEYDLEILNVRRGGQVSAGFYEAQAAQDRYRAGVARSGGAIGAGATMLTGASSLGMSAARMLPVRSGPTYTPSMATSMGGYAPTPSRPWG